MAEVVHALKSPYSSGYVKLAVPSSMTLDQLRDAVKLSSLIASDLAGATNIPQSFSTFPINRIGNVALMLVSFTMPDKLADGIEGTLLLDMMAAIKFLRQVIDRVYNKIPMKRDDYIFSVVSYCMRFTPHFAEALRMRLPVLVKQAFDSVPSVLDMAQRLSRLGDIAITTISTLRSIVGDEKYEQWLQRKDLTRSTASSPQSISAVKELQKEEHKHFGKSDDDEDNVEKLVGTVPPNSPSKDDDDVDDKQYDVPDEAETKSEVGLSKERKDPPTKEESDSEETDTEDFGFGTEPEEEYESDVQEFDDKDIPESHDLHK